MWPFLGWRKGVDGFPCQTGGISFEMPTTLNLNLIITQNPRGSHCWQNKAHMGVTLIYYTAALHLHLILIATLLFLHFQGFSISVHLKYLLSAYFGYVTLTDSAPPHPYSITNLGDRGFSGVTRQVTDTLNYISLQPKLLIPSLRSKSILRRKNSNTSLKLLTQSKFWLSAP